MILYHCNFSKNILINKKTIYIKNLIKYEIKILDFSLRNKTFFNKYINFSYLKIL